MTASVPPVPPVPAPLPVSEVATPEQIAVAESAHTCRHGDEHAPGGAVTRRRLLGVGAALAALGSMDVSRRGAAALAAGTAPVVMDLRARSGGAVSMDVVNSHEHGSFSEGAGSAAPASHALVASRAEMDGVTVNMTSDHDWRLVKHGARTGTTFSSQTADRDPASGVIWQYSVETANVASTGAVTFGARSGAGLALRAAPARSGAASAGAVLDHRYDRSNLSFRGSLAKVRHVLHVTPDVGGLDAAGTSALEYVLGLGPRPRTVVGSTTIPAGVRTLVYRLVAPTAAALRGSTRTYTVHGTEGVVTVAVVPGVSNEVVCDFTRDISALWADMNPETNGGDPTAAWDNALATVRWRAVSSGGRLAAGTFDGLVIDNSFYLEQPKSDAVALMIDTITARNRLRTAVGLEVSGYNVHAGLWLPPGRERELVVPEYPAATRGGEENPGFYAQWLDAVDPDALTVQNHPFGSSYGTEGSRSAQLATASRLAYAALMRRGPGGGLCRPLPWKAVELYPLRENVGTYGHEAYLMMLWANCQFPVWMGASDNHGGAAKPKRFFTRTWTAADDPTRGFWDGLYGGRAWLSLLGQYGGALDLTLGGDGLPEVSAGQIAVMPGVDRRPLTLLATGLADLPAGSVVEVVQTEINGNGFGAVYDPAALAPRSTVVGTWTAQDLAPGAVTVSVDTSSRALGSFWHARVKVPSGDPGGYRVVALLNPLAHLQVEPTGTTPGVPRALPAWKTVVRV